MELSDIRTEIDQIDDELVSLIVRRLKVADEVADAKRLSGKAVRDPAREREVFAKVSKAAGLDFENEVRLFYEALLSVSRARQRERLSDASDFGAKLSAARAATPASFPSAVCVACPGAEGGYSQQAATALVRDPILFYFKDFDAVFSAVEKGMCAYGVLPIENSAAGSVTQVYDLMAKHAFSIARAKKLRIRHVLLAPKGTKLENVTKIVSHPHALTQCSAFLKNHATIATFPASNTALAAAEVTQSGATDTAVIAARECAELYGLDVLAEDISDTTNNYTRFICISRSCEIYSETNRISLMMSLPHRTGALSEILLRFAAAGVSLTKLESRPVVGSDFEFRFIFDFEASLRDSGVLRLLKGLATDPEIEHFTFLGAYEEK